MDLNGAWAQTIHTQAVEAIVPLANGYFQVMKTSQCQAVKLTPKFVLQSRKEAGMEDHRMNTKVLQKDLWKGSSSFLKPPSYEDKFQEETL